MTTIKIMSQVERPDSAYGHGVYDDKVEALERLALIVERVANVLYQKDVEVHLSHHKIDWANETWEIWSNVRL